MPVPGSLSMLFPARLAGFVGIMLSITGLWCVSTVLGFVTFYFPSCFAAFVAVIWLRPALWHHRDLHMMGSHMICRLLLLDVSARPR